MFGKLQSYKFYYIVVSIWLFQLILSPILLPFWSFGVAVVELNLLENTTDGVLIPSVFSLFLNGIIYSFVAQPLTAAFLPCQRLFYSCDK
jgi:hypothetical protein